MDQMKDILERYWICETTIEEEQLLRDWFRKGDIPAELVKYRSIFLLQNDVAEQKTNPALMQGILDATCKETRKSLTMSFYPTMKVAACALVVVSLGIGIYTHYQQEKFLDELFSETYTDPKDALKETRAALDKVSSSFSKVQELIDAQGFIHELQLSESLDSIPEILEDTIN